MATLDRIEPAYTAWTPSTASVVTPSAAGIATDDGDYVGRHRKPASSRGLSLHRLFYRARHRTR